jgi:ABC-type transport system involved in multi-copper enzyme maturation permease subunit
MYLLDNPVLQRELLVNLRMVRAFVLLLLYVGLLGMVVYAAWPPQERLDLSSRPPEAQRLINLFFLGQFVLMSLMVPSFAGGAITGEKERRTYEMLLASPMRPGAIVTGKLLASLCHLGVLVVASLPIVMLCLPLGGMSFWEVVAAYVAMGAAVVTFGMICVAASAFFTRTLAALVVSYLIILPLALFGVLFFNAFASPAMAEFRLVMLGLFFPAGCAAACAVLFGATCRRLLHPPDVGAEAKEVVDPDLEQRTAVGMVIRSDQFPDKLFAPPKRTDLMADGLNPVYDKEMRSELFGSGTLMLRLVIQLSMFLALPLMAACLYMWPELAPWYTSYVLAFNMLVGPVFAAGSVTSERERQTLDLLLCTIISPWQIVWGKLLSSLRVSCVLTSFLVWPLLLSWLLPPWTYIHHSGTMLGYLGIIVLTSLTTTTLAMFCSVIFRKTSVAMIASYLLVLVLFAAPVAVGALAGLLIPDVPGARETLLHHAPSGQLAEAAVVRVSGWRGSADVRLRADAPLAEAAAAIQREQARTGVSATAQGAFLILHTERGGAQEFVRLEAIEGRFDAARPATYWIERATFTSPLAASFALPLSLATADNLNPTVGREGNLPVFYAHMLFYALLNVAILGSIVWLFNMRWRVSS